MKVIIYKTEENGVAVLMPTNEWTGTMEELASKDVPQGAEHYIVDASTIPADRKYRRFWEIQNGMVEVNQTKANQAEAEAIAKEEAIEAIRASALQKLVDNAGLTVEEVKSFLKIEE
jgi:hypothetical protein